MNWYPSPPPPPTVGGPPSPIRSVGAPLGVIIAFGVIAGLLVLLLTAVNPVGTAIGFILSSLALTGVVLAYLWLDRWEPEPPRLLLLAFGWGASVAVLLSVGIEMFAASLFEVGGPDSPSALSVAVGAPLAEEAAKGLFLLIMMTGRRRNELNSLTDCMVYAGLTAVGFSWLENILYIASAETLTQSLTTAALRLVIAPFAHPLFTTVTAVGVYFALRQRSGAAKVSCIVLGYLGAVLMHALWNGSSLLGLSAYVGVYVLWMMPMFGLAIGMGLASRRREQRVVADKLPGMVAAYLVTPNEATWLASIRNRRFAVGEATRLGGRPAGRAVTGFAAAVIRLAFVRDRIDRGLGDPRVLALQQQAVQELGAARWAAPILGWLTGYRAPDALGWHAGVPR